MNATITTKNTLGIWSFIAGLLPFLYQIGWIALSFLMKNNVLATQLNDYSKQFAGDDQLHLLHLIELFLFIVMGLMMPIFAIGFGALQKPKTKLAKAGILFGSLYLLLAIGSNWVL